MATVLRMPEVAANGTEAGLQEWALGEGAEFAAGDVLATVETDKAVVEVEAEQAGVLLRTLVAPGALVEVGAPIAVLTAVGENVTDADAVLAELGVAGTSGGAELGSDAGSAGGSDAGSEAGSSNGGARMSERREVADGPAAGSDPAAAAAASTAQEESDHVELPDGDGGRVFASPLARRLAAEAGIPIEQIRGTGPGGRVRRRDVEAAEAARAGADASPASPAASTAGASAGSPVASAPAAPTPSTQAAAAGPQPVSGAAPATRRSVPAATGGSTDVPHSRMRRAIASRLLESKQTTPHFYLRASVRVDELVALRARLNDSSPADRISVNDLVLKAAARAHSLVPDMNVIWTPDATRRFDTVDIAVAVATPGGLLTPVLRDVQHLSIGAVATATKALVAKARDSTLTQAELEGGSLSVTNLGMYGTEEFAAIINPPQSAILAVGAARQEPVVVDGALQVGTVMRVTLSVDHRAVDGAVAAQWLAAFVGAVEKPFGLLL